MPVPLLAELALALTLLALGALLVGAKKNGGFRESNPRLAVVLSSHLANRRP
jgi:hypothetical protein